MHAWSRHRPRLIRVGGMSSAGLLAMVILLEPGASAPGQSDGMGQGHGRAVIASSVQGWVLPHLVALVESRDVDPAPIRRLFGRTKLEDPNVRIHEAVTEKAWRLAATLTCDEALGIHLAESLPRGALDLIEYALRSSPSLEKGLTRLARYGRLLSDRVATRTHRKEDSLLFLVHDAATTPLHPARTEFALAVALKLARDIRERTSHRSASPSLIPHRATLRSIGGSSTNVSGLPPARVR